jgi:hypothetical protein
MIFLLNFTRYLFFSSHSICFVMITSARTNFVSLDIITMEDACTILDHWSYNNISSCVTCFGYFLFCMIFLVYY